jgi:porin
MCMRDRVVDLARRHSWAAPAVGLALLAATPRPAEAQSPPSSVATLPSAGGPGADEPRAPATKIMLTYASDLLSDIAGGDRRGAIYEGRLGLVADANLQDLIGPGWTGHLSVHLIHGPGLSAHDVGNLLTVSGLEAEPALRLFNLWVQAPIGKHGSLRVGQFTAAQEFTISPTANLFVNSTFGWPAAFAIDLPSGGPAYPLAAPGVRVSLKRDEKDTFIAAVFAGDPAGPGANDPQRRDRTGLNGWRFSGRAFAIAEAQRTFGEDGAGVIKVGAWRHFDDFAAVGGADPRRLRGDWAGYAVIDGPIWRSSSGGGRALNGFVRASASPSARNQIDRYVDAGLALSAPFAARAQDHLGLGVAWARVSPSARAATGTMSPPGAASGPVLDYEAVVELTYQAVVRTNFSVQPDIQYVVHPNGGRSLLDPTRKAKDALVAGLRTSLVF